VYRWGAVALVLVLLQLLAPMVEGSRASGVTFPRKPDGVNNFVADEARMMSATDISTANSVLRSLRTSEGTPIMVATITSMGAYGATGYSIERYAFELFNSWSIGTGGKSNGILLLVSRDDRLARIEFGLDWAHRYDAEAQAIMDGQIISRFMEGKFSEGILSGIRALDSLSRTTTLPASYSPSDDGGISATGVIVLVIAGAVLLAVFASVARSGTDGWGWAALKVMGSIVVFLLIARLFAPMTAAVAGGGGATGSW
jgi:uncharacterized protein